MPPRGSPTLLSGGQNAKPPTNGPRLYMTLAAWGIPNASKQGTKSELAHKWVWCIYNSCRVENPQRYKAKTKCAMAHRGARCLHYPYRVGDP